MTLYVVISDTHGDVRAAERAMARFPLADVIHLGDHARDVVRLAARHPERRIIGVSGNCDFNADEMRFPTERTLEVEGKRLLLTHGHRYGVKYGYEKLLERARSGGFDLVLFGHTHIAADFVRLGCHLVNPGSASQPRGVEGPSYALVEIGGGRIETRLMEDEQT